MEIDVIFGGIWYLVKEGGMENGVAKVRKLAKIRHAQGDCDTIFWFAEDPNCLCAFHKDFSSPRSEHSTPHLQKNNATNLQ